ncbi:hypothetical protein QAD02_022343 [Eretmocerus hayati]|uniref:Uncharacterized protein n=1 Tax=Eretmocerus hayati TaxID=131215 RepID=A0ACC2PTB1_9HYME|nr:hypothetical protein QAD02_022343 [Eretmocerus hayati]
MLKYSCRPFLTRFPPQPDSRRPLLVFSRRGLRHRQCRKDPRQRFRVEVSATRSAAKTLASVSASRSPPHVVPQRPSPAFPRRGLRHTQCRRDPCWCFRVEVSATISAAETLAGIFASRSLPQSVPQRPLLAFSRRGLRHNQCRRDPCWHFRVEVSATISAAETLAGVSDPVLNQFVSQYICHARFLLETQRSVLFVGVTSREKFILEVSIY